MFSGMPVVARKVEYSYGSGNQKQQVLADVNFELAQGELCVVTGPSGSGKTTFLSLCGALRQSQHGSLQVLGEELSGAGEFTRAQTRRRIGFIFQHHNLLSFLTARQNVVVAAELAGLQGADATRQAEMLLGRVGLADHRHKFPAQLSGGQKQRVAIARSLAGNPRLILADEPTASLDAASAQDVIQLLQDITSNEGVSVLLVTHDQRVMQVATRIVRMADGLLASDTALDDTGHALD
ncbi:MAG: ATP-binding cassette domain-containing protein [Candidatus Obscuribacterales bacterium]